MGLGARGGVAWRAFAIAVVMGDLATALQTEWNAG